MNTKERKSHWEKVYENKATNEMTWYQARPDISLLFLEDNNIDKKAKIIDVGGGDSLLVDYLIEKGYEDITVLDVSEKALSKAKKRLGKRAQKIKWICADVANFIPNLKYDFWHDRAAFHFLIQKEEIDFYIENVKYNINKGGYLILGTFSKSGPEKCSGLKIKQYTENMFTEKLNGFYEKIKCLTIDHLTPSNGVQNFIFCSFRRI